LADSVRIHCSRDTNLFQFAECRGIEARHA
jgi:hypothetical protein